jgi:hypothetical protein
MEAISVDFVHVPPLASSAAEIDVYRRSPVVAGFKDRLAHRPGFRS